MLFLLLPTDRICWAVPSAYHTTGAGVGDAVSEQFLTVMRWAFLVADMSFVFGAEVLDCRLNWIRRCLT